MNDIDKIIELFQSTQYELAFQLAEGIGISKYEFLEYIWNNESEYYDNNPDENDDYLTVQRCYIGEFELTKEYNTEEDYYEWFLINDEDNDWYFSTLYNALGFLIRMIENE